MNPEIVTVNVKARARFTVTAIILGRPGTAVLCWIDLD
jgi:hypothetical protein